MKGATRGLREEWMEENFKGNLSEVNTRAVSRGQNELVGKFKKAVGDMVRCMLRSTRTFQQESKGS